jgi:hypothetical protein
MLLLVSELDKLNQMEAWKKKAFEMFPERRAWIEELLEEDRAGALWFGLLTEFEAAYAKSPIDEDFIRCVYEYAWWSLDDIHCKEVVSAVIIFFFEQLPTNEFVRKDLPNRMTREDFLGVKNLFKYNLTEDEYDAFVKGFLESTGNILTAQSLRVEE